MSIALLDEALKCRDEGMIGPMLQFINPSAILKRFQQAVAVVEPSVNQDQCRLHWLRRIKIYWFTWREFTRLIPSDWTWCDATGTYQADAQAMHDWFATHDRRFIECKFHMQGPPFPEYMHKFLGSATARPVGAFPRGQEEVQDPDEDIDISSAGTDEEQAGDEHGASAVTVGGEEGEACGGQVAGSMAPVPPAPPQPERHGSRASPPRMNARARSSTTAASEGSIKRRCKESPADRMMEHRRELVQIISHSLIESARYIGDKKVEAARVQIPDWRTVGHALDLISHEADDLMPEWRAADGVVPPHKLDILHDLMFEGNNGLKYWALRGRRLHDRRQWVLSRLPPAVRGREQNGDVS